MRIFNKLTLSFIASVSALLVGCNDLEQTPSNKFTDSSFWTSAERAQYVVNMAYSQMYNADWMWTDESLSDNLFDGRSVTDQRLMRRGMATPSVGVYAGQWSSIASGLKTCHVFLKNIDLVPQMNETLKARMMAEVHFIRASLYLRFTNLFGDIPFFTSDISLEEAGTISRTPANQVMAFILNWTKL